MRGLLVGVVAILVLLPVGAARGADQTISTVAGTNVTVTFDVPIGVAVDGSDNVFIADSENHQVWKFDPTAGFSVYAGTGSSGYTGDGGAATAAKMNKPYGLAVDGDGNLYIADKDEDVIRKVNVATGVITTYAGTGSGGYTGDGGAATAAKLDEPWGLAVDGDDNLYIAGKKNHVVRQVDAATGVITTVAGDGSDGDDGDGGVATSAELGEPYAVAVDSLGDLYIADKKNHRVRKVDMGTGIITAFAGTGSSGTDGDGGPATAAKLSEPSGLAVDASDNVYIANRNKHVIRKVDAATGNISTFAGTTSAGYDGDGDLATLAKIDEPFGLAADGEGNVYIGDSKNNVVRKVFAADGTITSLNGSGAYFGDGGLAILAKLNAPWAVAVDSSNNMYIADTDNRVIRKVTASTGIITTYAGTGDDGYTGDGGAATSAELKKPYGVAVDSSGNVYIADKDAKVIRKVTKATGIITTVAGTGSAGYDGDGGAATSAKLDEPHGVAVDNDGNLYIAGKKNHVIRKVDGATGVISTFAGTGSSGYSGDGGAATAAKLEEPYGVAVDSAGNVYIAQKKDHVIRKVDTAGIITTIAGTGSSGYSGDGGLATAAKLEEPWDVAVDKDGHVYIAGKKKHVVRRVDAATGIITTVAGTGGSAGYSGDGGLASLSELEEPHGVAVNRAGDLYIADKKNNVIRMCDFGDLTRTIISWQEVEP